MVDTKSLNRIFSSPNVSIALLFVRIIGAISIAIHIRRRFENWEGKEQNLIFLTRLREHSHHSTRIIVSRWIYFDIHGARDERLESINFTSRTLQNPSFTPLFSFTLFFSAQKQFPEDFTSSITILYPFPSC